MLQKTKINGSEPINLVEGISVQPKIQAVAWVLMATFSQVYARIKGEKPNKYLKKKKKTVLVQRQLCIKLGQKRAMFNEKTSTI